MKLSEAIALGRTLLKPRAYTTIWGDEGCALGMAMAANGCRTHSEAMEKSLSMGWHWMDGEPNPKPCNCKPESDFVLRHSQCYQAYVAHVFNEHVCGKGDWSLDRLIDWIASVEPADLPKPAPAPPAEQQAEAETVPGPISTL